MRSAVKIKKDILDELQNILLKLIMDWRIG
jgi:hypothetical protein